MDASIRSRVAWSRRLDRFPTFLAGFLERRLWKWPLRHMREFPKSVTFEVTGGGEWKICRNGLPVATTRTLLDWVGPIGRPLTIVASGPSARDIPTDALKDGSRMILAVNGAPTFLAERGIKPDLWVISDSDFAAVVGRHFEHAAGVPLAVPFKAAAFIAEHFPHELEHRPICLIERVNQWYGIRSLKRSMLFDWNEKSGRPFVSPTEWNGKSVVGWSHRPELGFYSGNSVVFAALQLAVRLGAQDIEIIGMDLSDAKRSYSEGDSAQPSALAKQYNKGILPSFEVMHEALSGRNVVIRNLSPVCPLPGRLFDF